MNKVVYLHQPSRVARFLRVSEHRKLERLMAADRLPYDRFILESGSFSEQADLVAALKEKKAELVLDTNVAELSSVGRFSRKAKNAPWANKGGVLTPSQLSSGSNDALISQIAKFAVEKGFARVHAPSHFLPSVDDPWLALDLDNCIALRKALDVEGGKLIQIDYPVMLPNQVFNDSADRKRLISHLSGMPANSFVLRISGFGSSSTAVGTRKYIAAAQDFHTLGKPIVADGVGGLVGLALFAFGAASAISHGVASRERFDATGWNKPQKPGPKGGNRYFMLLNGVDGLLSHTDAEAIIKAPGGRRLAACTDRNCCPHGFDDMTKDPKGHFLRQRARSYDELADVPDLLRGGHFLNKILPDEQRRAKLLSKLKLHNEKLDSRLKDNASRIELFSDVLGSLGQVGSIKTRSLSLGPSPLSERAEAMGTENG